MRSIVVNTGYFSDRMVEMLRRAGAEVVDLTAVPGEVPNVSRAEGAFDDFARAGKKVEGAVRDARRHLDRRAVRPEAARVARARARARCRSSTACARPPRSDSRWRRGAPTSI